MEPTLGFEPRTCCLRKPKVTGSWRPRGSRGGRSSRERPSQDHGDDEEVPTLPLDSRQASIARVLLERTGGASLHQVASGLHLTDRMGRYHPPAGEAQL